MFLFTLAAHAAPLDDALAEMIVDANTAYVGSSPIDEAGPRRLRPSVLRAQLASLVDTLEGSGCTPNALEGYAAGAYGTGADGIVGRTDQDAAVLATLDRVNRTFGGAIGDLVMGDPFATYAKGHLVASRSDGGWVAGRFARVSGTRGVFLLLQGRCVDGVPGDALSDWSPADLAAWPAPTTTAPGESFSTTDNPNGPWVFRHGATPIPAFQPDWDGLGVGAWAVRPSFPDHVPGFALATHPLPGFDLAIGDTFLHVADTSGPGLGDANVAWTASAAGFVSVEGAIWPVRDIGRASDWRLLIAGETVASGQISSGDPFDRATPAVFADHALAAHAGRTVEPGDEVVLEVTRATPTGDLAGYDLMLTFQPR